MAIDQEARRKRRVEMFRQVAAERVGKLNLAWIEFEQGAGDPAAFLREAHTLKGEASLTGFALAAKLVHAVEDYVKLVRDRGAPPAERDGDLILNGLDLGLRLAQGAPQASSVEAHGVIARGAALGGKPLDLTPAPTVSITPAPLAYASAQATRAMSAVEDSSGKTTPTPVLVRKENSIRVTSEKID